MKTREQLKAEGVELHGPIVPDWFRAQSDGCSVPTHIGRFFLRAEQARAACYIHDFRYFLTALQWQGASPEWVGDRMQADYELKQNRRLVARTRFFGWIYSRLFFRGVRLGGSIAMKELHELVMPPTPAALEQLERYLHIPMTGQARDKLAAWKVQLESI